MLTYFLLISLFIKPVFAQTEIPIPESIEIVSDYKKVRAKVLEIQKTKLKNQMLEEGKELLTAKVDTYLYEINELFDTETALALVEAIEPSKEEITNATTYTELQNLEIQLNSFFSEVVTVYRATEMEQALSDSQEILFELNAIEELLYREYKGAESVKHDTQLLESKLNNSRKHLSAAEKSLREVLPVIEQSKVVSYRQAHKKEIIEGYVKFIAANQNLVSAQKDLEEAADIAQKLFNLRQWELVNE